MQNKKRSLIFLSLFFIQSLVFASVKLPPIISDNMILQQNGKATLWGWADAGEKIKITTSWNKKSYDVQTDNNGNWKVDVATAKAGGPFTIRFAGSNIIEVTNVLLGEVWLASGQSNMDMTVAREDRYWCGVINEKEEVEAAQYPLIRVFDVDFLPAAEPQSTTIGKWELVSPQTVGHISAAAYFFARDLQQKLKMPIGLITTAYGASTAEAWIRRQALETSPNERFLLDSFYAKMNRYEKDTAAQSAWKIAYAKWKIDSAAAKAAGKDEVRSPRNPDPVRDQHNPAVLWNGMVNPLVPYAIKGALWYQGESNSPTASIYRQLMETLINDWRTQWKQGNFPFVYVQLANIGKKIDSLPAQGGAEAIKREAQLQNLSIPATAMVVAIDNADADNPGNVHPKNKQEIGRRLALAALSIAYGSLEEYSGPIYEKMEVKGNQILLHFTHAGKGLMAKDGQLNGFAIAGADKNFVWADAVIKNNVVIVSSPQITDPVAVRYGWGSNPPISLYNNDGLPASPFRTDDK